VAKRIAQLRRVGCSDCIVAVRNGCFPNGRQPRKMTIADAHDGLLPVPLQQLFPLEVYRPSYFVGRGDADPFLYRRVWSAPSKGLIVSEQIQFIITFPS